MTTRELINAQYDAIKAANAEIKRIQSECTHEHKTKKPYTWRPGSTMMVLMCDECDTIIPEYKG